ncbi:hypothetical protein GUJ93_ZPchr0005g15278 [Zizania palustris]|uniref:Uncharacterized protein n=1 Tax=Zizania palustris TaxID=103762 RepID=A0A8J5T8E7_ZIZPA|nr:hypothetical protein GUJ93_ZPchr0005g15278 [Zizania palustris]
MAAAEEEAAGAGVDEPAAPSPAPAPPEKRALADGDEEELPEPKRRRARVAALDNVRRAAADALAASKDDDGDDDDGAGEPADGRSPFSFHARGFTGVETTPKFGSFNPADELVAFQPKPPPPQMDAPTKEAVAPDGGDDTEEASTAEGNDGNSH